VADASAASIGSPPAGTPSGSARPTGASRPAAPRVITRSVRRDVARSELVAALAARRYDLATCGRVADDLVMLHPRLWSGFVLYWRYNQLETGLDIEGISLAELVGLRAVEPLGAYWMLDWLCREPRRARRAMRSCTDIPTLVGRRHQAPAWRRFFSHFP
jgi:hypothetical protein